MCPNRVNSYVAWGVGVNPQSASVLCMCIFFVKSASFGWWWLRYAHSRNRHTHTNWYFRFFTVCFSHFNLKMENTTLVHFQCSHINSSSGGHSACITFPPPSVNKALRKCLQPSPITMETLPDVLLHKIIGYSLLMDRFLALDLINQRWRRLSIQATSSSYPKNCCESFSTADFQKATIAYHFVFQNNQSKIEANEFLLRLLEHLLPRMGNKVKIVELLPKRERIISLEKREGIDEEEETVSYGFQISRRNVELLLRYCPNLEEIDFGQTYCDEDTATMLTRFPHLKGLIFRVAGENFLANILPQLRLTKLGTSDGRVTCAEPSHLRSLHLYNGWHREYEEIKTKLHTLFPNLEEIKRGKSRIYLDDGSDDTNASDEDDQQYLASVCQLKKLRKFDDMTSVIKSEEDLDQLLKSCTDFTSLRLTSTFEGDLKEVLNANWVRRIRTVCLCDLNLDLSCLRAILAIGTMKNLRLNLFVGKDVEEAANQNCCDTQVSRSGNKLTGEFHAKLRHLFVRVRGNQSHKWANQLTKEILESENTILKSFNGKFVCDQELLDFFGSYNLTGKGQHMVDLSFTTNCTTLTPIFDEDRTWPRLRSLNITCSSEISPTLDYWQPILQANLGKLRQLTTRFKTPSSSDQLQSTSNGASAFLSNLTVKLPKLRQWHTAETSDESEGYEIIRQMVAHPSLEEASVNGLFPKWKAGLYRAVYESRKALAANGRRMRPLNLDIFCNGERFISQSADSDSDQFGKTAFHVDSLWEVCTVDVN